MAVQFHGAWKGIFSGNRLAPFNVIGRISRSFSSCILLNSQIVQLNAKFCGKRVITTRSRTNININMNMACAGLHCSSGRQSKVYRKNEQITAKYVRLIDQLGKNLGIMSLDSALEIGQKEKCLVLEVGSSQSETVCKLTSEQQLYAKMKEEKKKHTKTTKTKEIKLTGKITDHDLDVKLKKIREFLEGHNSVKVFVAHRRRQNTSMGDKQAVIDNIARKVGDLGVLQGEPKSVGMGLRSVFVPHPRK